MTDQPFSLAPFPAARVPQITVTGITSLAGNWLRVHYSLAGDFASVALPRASTNPIRKDELWKSTCFEFFLAPEDQPQYWEFNLSPSGDWNVYRMDSYRRVGFREETSILDLQRQIERGPDVFRLNAAVDLSLLGLENNVIRMGIAAVIEAEAGDQTYWALTHPASQADFHRREGFILSLAGRLHPSRQSAPGG